MPALLVALLLSLLALAAVPAGAQSVRGTVRQEDTGTPVAGAMVVLLDGAGAAHASILSNEAGAFTLAAPAAGRYRLLVQRIGFVDVHSEYLELAAGATRQQDVTVRATAIVLDGISVQAAPRCVVRPADGLAVATLWEEARKALRATLHTERQGLFRYRTQQYRRDLDPATLRVVRETSRSGVRFTDNSPFLSLPAEQLLADGFIRMADSVTSYYAPDADVLLSDAFLDQYCFRLAAGPADGPDLVGISFEPVSRRGAPALTGTMWLHSTSFELRSLEFGYTRVALPDDLLAHARGRVEFEPLPGGAWIVRRWWIRMPIVAARPRAWVGSGAPLVPTVVTVIEEGGSVFDVAAASGRVIRPGARGRIEGAVYDSAAAKPLADAIVEVIGTDRRASTDDSGRFAMENMIPGEYGLAVSHPALAQYAMAPPTAAVSLDEGATAHVQLAVPAAAPTIEPGPVTLLLEDFDSGRPIADAAVSLPDIAASAVTDRQGRASFGAVPPGTHKLRMEHVAYGVHVRPIDVGAGGETFAVRVPQKAIALQGIEVTVRTTLEEARRSRGSRLNVLDRSAISRVEDAAEHVGHLAQRLPGLYVRETYHLLGGLRMGLCIQARRVHTFSESEHCAVIYLDDMPVWDTSHVLAIPPDEIESIEFLPPNEAGQRYGTNAGLVGVLLVHTLGRGPYARSPHR